MSDLRFTSKDVTETLIHATELASEIKPTHIVVILYRNVKEEPVARLRYLTNDDCTIETANWLLDKLKWFLHSE